jgi:hypothetical protein
LPIDIFICRDKLNQEVRQNQYIAEKWKKKKDLLSETEEKLSKVFNLLLTHLSYFLL